MRHNNSAVDSLCTSPGASISVSAYQGEGKSEKTRNAPQLPKLQSPLHNSHKPIQPLPRLRVNPSFFNEHEEQVECEGLEGVGWTGGRRVRERGKEG